MVSEELDAVASALEGREKTLRVVEAELSERRRMNASLGAELAGNQVRGLGWWGLRVAAGVHGDRKSVF